MVLKGINDAKAPGCDGYNVVFFKKAWPVIGEDVTTIVLEFSMTRNMFQTINYTTITFIPKILNASRVSEFRLISYCIILCKLISKIITR